MNSRVGRTRVVATLGTAQTLAWASSYYLPAVLAVPVAAELGLSVSTVFALFSLALLVSAAVGLIAGAAIDRHGGRPVLMGTNAGGDGGCECADRAEATALTAACGFSCLADVSSPAR
jgi:MFS family permease